MASRPMIARLTGRMYWMPAKPRGISRVRAASGPYAAELRASRPKTGMPETGPMWLRTLFRCGERFADEKIERRHRESPEIKHLILDSSTL